MPSNSPNRIPTQREQIEGLRKVDAIASPYVLACLADGRTASWMIANAPTEQCLVEAAIFAQARKDVTHELRLKWANQIHFRMQQLKPARWEKVGVAEALGEEVETLQQVRDRITPATDAYDRALGAAFAEYQCKVEKAERVRKDAEASACLAYEKAVAEADENADVYDSAKATYETSMALARQTYEETHAPAFSQYSKACDEARKALVAAIGTAATHRAFNGPSK